MDKVRDQYLQLVGSQGIDGLRRFAAKAEQAGRLTQEQLEIIYSRKWFKAFVPGHFDGLEMTVPQGVRLEEALAYIDGSVGWTVTLCAGATMFVGYLDQAVTPSIFADEKVCFGGSGQPLGRAVEKEGGYELSGKWPYATGAPHNTVFTANCIMERNGHTCRNPDGSPVIKSFFVGSQDVSIIYDWNTFGLKATASHSFAVRKLRVKKSNSFFILPHFATLPHPVYQYPFVQFAEITLAANFLGMAFHFFEECEALFAGRGHADHAVHLLQSAIRELDGIRDAFYGAIDFSWAEMTASNAIKAENLDVLSGISRKLVRAAREEVVKLYPYAGMAAAREHTAINRIWRDIFTASQHGLFREV